MYKAEIQTLISESEAKRAMRHIFDETMYIEDYEVNSYLGRTFIEIELNQDYDERAQMSYLEDIAVLLSGVVVPYY